MKYYNIILSTKQEIIIDEEDFNKVTASMPSGNLIKVKQGIFNPSFVVAIIPVEKTPQDNIEGYVDEETGKFIVTKRETGGLENKFSPEVKKLK